MVWCRSYAPRDLPDKQSEGEVLQVEPVPAALHGGCPVLEGQKWIVTRCAAQLLYTP